MLKHSSKLPAKKKVGANKLVVGFAAIAATAIVGTSGVAAAAQRPADKPTKEQCAAAGYSNYGQCVRKWAQDRTPGYGGTNINIGIDIRGDNNVINIILNVLH